MLRSIVRAPDATNPFAKRHLKLACSDDLAKRGEGESMCLADGKSDQETTSQQGNQGAALTIPRRSRICRLQEVMARGNQRAADPELVRLHCMGIRIRMMVDEE